MRPRRDVERLDLAGDADALLGGDAERVDQPPDLAARVADRLARLDAQRIGELVGALGEAGDAVGQHRLPLVRRQPAHRALGGVSGGNARVDRRRVGERDAGRRRAGELVGDDEVGVGLLGLAGEVERVFGAQTGHRRSMRRRPRQGNGLTPSLARPACAPPRRHYRS